MKTLVLLFATLILCLSLQAQEKAAIQWGQALKTSKRSSLADIVGYDQSGFYAIKTESRTFGIALLTYTKTIITLERYNNKMNPDRSSELKLEFNNEKMDYEQIIQLNDELYVFSSLKDQKDKKNKLFVQTIDKNTLLPSYDIKQIGEVDYAGNMKSNAGNFNLRLSRDSSKVLVYYNLPYEKHENEKFGFHVLDAQLNEIWSKQIFLPYEEALFEIEDYKVDNKGNVHILGVVFKEKRKEKRKGQPNYNYEVLSYFQKDDGVKSYTISLEDKFLTDMQIAVNDDLDIICSGFYSSVGTFGIIGTYFIKVNGKTKEITTKSFKEFGLDFITQNMTKREEEKTTRRAEKGKDVEMYEYDLDDIIIHSNGGATLIGEQYFVRTYTTTTNNPTTGATSTYTTYYYNYNDIIVISISPSGEIEWTQKVPKVQVTSNDNGFYSSYVTSVVKDKIYFVFNDHPKNITEPSETTYAFRGWKNSMVVLVEVDAKGNMTKQPLFSAKDAEVITRPKVCEQVSKKEMILFGQKRKQQQFAKITFN